MTIDDYPDLVEAINAKRCVLFLGAGVSAGQEGMPLGGTLAQQLAHKARLCLGCQNEDPVATERELPITCKLEGYCKWSLQTVARYFDASGQNLQNELTAIFDRIGKMPAHDLIAELHEFFPRIITTNYDTLLEQAYDNLNQKEFGSSNEPKTAERRVSYMPITRKSKDFPSPNQVSILKIHGSIRYGTDGYPLVITDDHYYELLNDLKNPEHQSLPLYQLLNQYLTQYRVIFIGYSLEDSTLNLLLTSIARTLGDHLDRYFAIQRPADPNNRHTYRVQELNDRYWDTKNVTILRTDLLVFLQEVRDKVTSEKEQARRIVAEAITHNKVRLDRSEYKQMVQQEIQPRNAREVELFAQSALVYDSDPESELIDRLDQAKQIEICQDLLGDPESDEQEAQHPRVARINAIRVLARLQEESNLPFLLKGLRDKDSEVSHKAQEAILDFPPALVLDNLFKYLLHSEEVVRENAATALSKLANKFTIRDRFSQQLNNEPLENRILIFEALRNVDGTARLASLGFRELKLIDLTIAILSEQPNMYSKGALMRFARTADTNKRLQIIKALGDNPQALNVCLLDRMIELDQSKEHIDAIVEALVNTVQDTADQSLNPYSDEFKSQVMALDRLAEMPDVPRTSLIRTLRIELMEGRHHEIRVQACRSIQRFYDGDVSEILRDYLGDEDIEFAKTVFYAIQQGNGTDLLDMLYSLIRDYVIQEQRRLFILAQEVCLIELERGETFYPSAELLIKRVRELEVADDAIKRNLDGLCTDLADKMNLTIDLPES
ncbi:MAG: hypothetical protein EYC68_21520 [Chloroflexota bacterium]|nr:MAG: hypothetical protein EYC68_21520 [Chloroflexota bacterium]